MANSLCRSCSLGTAPHCSAQFKRQGSGAEQSSPTHKVQEPKAVVIDTQQHLVTSSPLMLKSSVPPLPLHSFLSQHPVACQECNATQNGQVLQGLEHVELSPVDIHESQHCWGKKRAHGWNCISKTNHLSSSEQLYCQAWAFGSYPISEALNGSSKDHIIAREWRHLGSHSGVKMWHWQLATNSPVAELWTYYRH